VCTLCTIDRHTWNAQSSACRFSTHDSRVEEILMNRRIGETRPTVWPQPSRGFFIKMYPVFRVPTLPYDTSRYPGVRSRVQNRCEIEIIEIWTSHQSQPRRGKTKSVDRVSAASSGKTKSGQHVEIWTSHQSQPLSAARRKASIRSLQPLCAARRKARKAQIGRRTALETNRVKRGCGWSVKIKSLEARKIKEN
jgi:hypothetical protein